MNIKQEANDIILLLENVIDKLDVNEYKSVILALQGWCLGIKENVLGDEDFNDIQSLYNLKKDLPNFIEINFNIKIEELF